MTIDAETWAVIVHEASHCVIGHRLGLMVKWVEISHEDGGGSRVVEGPNLVDWLTVLLAGETAEVEFFGRQILPRVHARSDRERFYQAIVKAGPMGRQAEFVARQKVVKLVHVHRPAILELSHSLLARVAAAWGGDASIGGDELTRLLDADGSAILRLAATLV